MIEVFGNLWNFNPRSPEQSVRCITVNGSVTRDLRLVMGRGTALQAKYFIPTLPIFLAQHRHKKGNVVRGPFEIMGMRGKRYMILSFPTKHKWEMPADLPLIRQSAASLDGIARTRPHLDFILPRPGCGVGGLKWDVVRPWLLGLPDNVYVIEKKGRV